MRTYRYLHYDVFTDSPFEGNQLAVFPEPAGLSTEEMQTIAREMNFSESTFIFPPDIPKGSAGTPQPGGSRPTDVRMRIFTPGEELPMAGHPTIGSTFALAFEGVIATGQQDFVFGLGIGPIAVAMEWKDKALDFAWMTQPLPTFGTPIPDRAAMARGLGITEADFASQAPQVVSCGVPFLFIPLTTRAGVDRVSIDRQAYVACLKAAAIEELPAFIFTVDRGGSTGDEGVYSRMLAPGFGITEDPATGGASGPLGCYLFKHRLVPRERLSRIISLQGVAMKRPSRIHISIEGTGDEITRVRIGGRSVLVGEGSLRF
jgi:trans-2,3-dihydro-3-hydroxyanthranilate isomerase